MRRSVPIRRVCALQQVRVVFTDAVEQGKELLDRRAGRKPATSHDPVDFLTERVEYDASLVAMEFDEQFVPLPDKQAAKMSARDAVEALRACARRSDDSGSGLGAVERLLMWHRFHTAPESVRKKTCARLAGAPNAAILCGSSRRASALWVVRQVLVGCSGSSGLCMPWHGG